MYKKVKSKNKQKGANVAFYYINLIGFAGAYAGFLRGGGPTLNFLGFMQFMHTCAACREQRSCEPILGGFGGMPPQEIF